MFKGRVFLCISIILLIVSAPVSAKMLESARPKLSTRQQRMNKIQRRVVALNKKLDLNEQQRKQITDILTKVKEEVVKMLEATGERIREVKRGGEEDIEEVLSPKQRKVFNNVREQEEDEDIVKVFKSSY
jgi:Spy/CpxP family protein refolding chaperone